MDAYELSTRTCRVCRTELLCVEDVGAEIHQDVEAGAACAKVRNGRTEAETVSAALRSIDRSGSLRNFKAELNG